MNHLTIRNVPPDVAAALEREKQRRGASLNRTVIELLKQSLGVGAPAPASNGLRRFAGTWTAEEFAEFEAATEFTEAVDDEIWR